MNTRIKELRKVLNLKQKDFGNAIGLRSSISDIELRKSSHYRTNYYCYMLKI